MAELTHLEEKLAEVTGLAMAAEAATEKVMKLTEEEDESLVATLQTMAEEAARTEERCTELAGGFDGKKTAILDEAREVKQKAAKMMETYLDPDAEALDGFEFLTMAEAAEVGHWSVLRTLNQKAGHDELAELIEWALPIQQRHLARRARRLADARGRGGPERARVAAPRAMTEHDPIPPTLPRRPRAPRRLAGAASRTRTSRSTCSRSRRAGCSRTSRASTSRATRRRRRRSCLATDIWDRVLKRFPKDVTYWMSQRLLVDEAEQPRPDGGAAILASARSLIAQRADLLESEGFEQVARAFRRLLDETAGVPPADLIWSALALRLAEPFLQDATNPVPGREPTSPAPPAPVRE